MSYALEYDPCFNCDKKDIMCSMCELTYHRNKQIIEEKTKQIYCKYCFNARIYKPTDEELMDPYNTELTDENDSSSCGVGHCFSRDRRFMINSGHGHPVNIEFEEWTEKMPEWHRVGIYYPKYCPECGRKIDEYDRSKFDD